MGIVVSCANLATIYHNTKYSGGKVVNYLHISRKCLTLVSCCLDFAIAHENGDSWCLLSFGMRSGCVRDALGMHLERVRHLTICRTMEFFLACLKSATKSFNVLLASKRPLITELSDKLRQKYLLSRFIGCAPLYCIYSTYTKTKEENHCWFSSWGDPLGARTQDPNIKSVVLYQLS